MKKQAGKISIKREKRDTILGDVLNHITQKRIIKLNKNEHLYRQFEPIKGIYYLVSGQIKVVQKDKDEKYRVLHSVKAPELIGLASILYEESYPNSAYSIEESKIIFIPKKEFLEVLNENQQITLDLMKLLCKTINKTEAQIPQIVQ